MENKKNKTEQFLETAVNWAQFVEPPPKTPSFGQYLQDNLTKESEGNRFIIKDDYGIVLAKFTLGGKNPKMISGMLTKLSLDRQTFSFTIIGGTISGGSRTINRENVPIDDFKDITTYQILQNGEKFVIQDDRLIKIKPLNLNHLEVKKEGKPCALVPA